MSIFHLSRRTWRFALAAVPGIMFSTACLADWDAETQRLYGGTYSSDCGNPAAPRLRAARDALTVEVGNHRMTGAQVQISVAPFGQQEPRPGEQRVMLIGETRSGQLVFYVQLDRSGQSARLDGDPKVMAALGRRLTSQRFPHCDASRSQRAAAQAASDVRRAEADAAAAAAASRTPDARRFNAALRAALGPKAREAWLVEQLGQPGADSPRFSIAGTDYQQLSGCKPHDCGDNNALVIYAPSTGAVYGKLLIKAVPAFVGAPPPVVMAELERRWRSEWRQGR